MTYAELSQYINVKTGTLYAWTCRGKIPFIRFSGRMVRFDRAVIDEWVEQKREVPR